jgi:hypothetical protein
MAALFREAADESLSADDDLAAIFGSVPDIAARVPQNGVGWAWLNCWSTPTSASITWRGHVGFKPVVGLHLRHG